MMEQKLIEEEVAKRVQELVEKRVAEELERRKEEIEAEVKRRVEEAKKQMEEELMAELERQRLREIENKRLKEVEDDHQCCELWREQEEVSKCFLNGFNAQSRAMSLLYVALYCSRHGLILTHTHIIASALA